MKAPGQSRERGRQGGGGVRARDLLASNMGARAAPRHGLALADTAPVQRVLGALAVARAGGVGAEARERGRRRGRAAGAVGVGVAAARGGRGW